MKLIELGFYLLHATQMAAVESSRWVGRGDKNAADQAAVDAMRSALADVPGAGVVVIGEGEKDQAPMLYVGETIGPGEPLFDIAVDPLDGTTQTARGGPEAMSVIAVGRRGSLYPAPEFYMKKIAVGPAPDGKPPLLSLDWPIPRLVESLTRQWGRPASELTVCLLDRPRHQEFIKEFRALGCRLRLIADCDVSAAIATALPDSPVDLYYGIGGAPEGVIAAAAMKCLGGYFEGQLVDEKGTPTDGRVLTAEELAAGEVMVCATGVTTGSLLTGVKEKQDEVVSHSILMHYPGMCVHRISTARSRR